MLLLYLFNITKMATNMAWTLFDNWQMNNDPAGATTTTAVASDNSNSSSNSTSTIDQKKTKKMGVVNKLI